jgi:hypothetical protein
VAIVRPSQTCAKAIEIYGKCGIQSDKRSPQSRSTAKQELSITSDTVQFSQEALDRLELLKKRQTKEVSIQIQTILEEDSKLEKSLKMLEMDRDSSVEEIRNHPDKHAYLPPEFRQLAEITSKRINELYSTLLKRKTGNPRRS